MLKRQAGVAFAPKDLRSSFVTFLLSDANPDGGPQEGRGAGRAPLDGAAEGSATYDKERAERLWAAARPCRWQARSPRASSEART